LQASPGKKLDPGASMEQGTEGHTEPDTLPQSYKIPTQADFLIAYSTAEGKTFSF